MPSTARRRRRDARASQEDAPTLPVPIRAEHQWGRLIHLNPQAAEEPGETTEAEDARSLDDDAWERDRGLQLGVGLGVVGLSLAIATAAMLLLTHPGGSPASEVGGAAAPSASPATPPAPTFSLAESFDELPIGATLPADWLVNGGGGAAIVPLPTSVDRSLRVRSSADGRAATVCRALPSGSVPAAISLDLLIGTGRASRSPIVTVVGSGQVLLALTTDGSKLLVDAGAAGAGVATPTATQGVTDDFSQRWQHLEIAVGTSPSAIAWRTTGRNDAVTATGTREISAEARAAIDRLCFSSPEGPRDSWIALNNVLIQG